ncbi:chitobiase/beta-hexosaminidase C-terminal domain-containing protein [Roseburia hominis]
MKCMNCGAEIPEGRLICPGCGREVQIVPDYNPLDDVLTAQVKGAISKTMSLYQDGQPEVRRSTDRMPSPRGANERGRTGYVTGNQRTGKRAPQGSTGRGRTGRVAQGNTGRGRTGRVSQGTGKSAKISREEQELRRRQAEKRRMMAKKKRMRTILILAVILAACVGIVFFLYQNSYSGLIGRGNKDLDAKEYAAATEKFEKAMKKDKKRGEAYSGLAAVYIEQDDLEKAEQMFLEALKDYPSNVEIYRAAIQFYCDTKQENKVSDLLDACSSDAVLSELSEFVSDTPQFSLDATKEYDDIQALELTGDGKAIYYTTDSTDPTTSSTKYTEPIKLDEGETEVRAISVNEKGIPSLVASRTYIIRFPVADAPAVTPSTGQYEGSQKIEVVVPAGYEAHYTMDATTPTENSDLYEGPIDMPKGKTIFSVVLVDKKGRLSDVTIRNYERTE